MQSTLGAALKISAERLAGTVLGALMGALLAKYFPINVPILDSASLRSVSSVPRSTSVTPIGWQAVTLAVIMLVGRTCHTLDRLYRFIEVAIGILVGLVVTAVWPETPTLEEAATKPLHE